MNYKRLENFGIYKNKKRTYEELSYLIAFVYNITTHKLEAVLRQNKISLANFNILMILKYKGKDTGMSQTDITNSLIVSDGNITRVLDRMQKEKLVIRTSHPTDRRANLIRITLKGSDLLEKLWTTYDNIIKSTLGTITEKEQKSLIATFHKIIKPLI